MEVLWFLDILWMPVVAILCVELCLLVCKIVETSLGYSGHLESQMMGTPGLIYLTNLCK